jgi:DNA-binding transcriptional MerR regulator
MERTITELADEVGATSDTLRYYDRIGLLPPTGRSPAGYRLYDEDALARLRFIKGAQRSGLRLNDVAELLEIWDRGQCPCGHTVDVVQRRLDEVDAELAALEATRQHLVDLARRNEECMSIDPSDWSCSTIQRKGGAK